MRGQFAKQGQKKAGRGRFFGMLSVLLLLCFAQYVFQINIHQGVFLAAALLIALLGDADEIIGMCICCIPLHNFFEFSFAVLLGIACYVLKYGKGIRLNYSIVPVALMVLWELAHCFIPDLNVTQFGGQCMPWILLAVLMCSSRTFDYDFIVRAFAFTVLAICCLLIGKSMYATNFDWGAVFSDIQRLGVESEAAAKTVMVNPNTLGIMCVLSITCLMQLRLAGRARKTDAVCSAVLLMFGVMSASKTFFFCLLFSVILLFFATEGSIREKMRYVFGAMAIALTVLIAAYLVMPERLNYFISRFYEEDFTTGRLDHMVIYGKFILSNPDVMLYGIGLQNFKNRLLQLCESAIHTPHNGILELIIAWGIPGIVLFLMLGLSMVFFSRKMCKRQRLVNYIPLMVILLKIQAGQMLTSAYTMLTFSLAYLSMSTDLRPGTQNIGEMKQPSDFSGMELGRAISVMLQKWRIIAIVSLMSAITAYGVSYFMVMPMYESSVLVYVNSSIAQGESNHLFSADDIWVSRNRAGTYEYILKSRSFLNEVMEQVGIKRSYTELRKMVSFAPINDTEIFRVRVTSGNPMEAESIANGIATLLPSYIQEIIGGITAKTVDYAVIESVPVSPRKTINAMVGCIFGFVLIVLIILLKGMADKRIRVLEDNTELNHYPLLAVIPDLYEAGR